MIGKPARRKMGRPVKVPGQKSTKERIFEAAIDLFSERGYDGVSIRDIGRAAGVSEGAVYKHYASKDDILESIFAYVEARIYSSPAPGGSMDAMVDALSFREILENIPRFMMADPYMHRIVRIMFIEMYHNEKVRDYIQRELFDRPVDETEALFRMLMEKGKVRHCDPRALSSLFISLLVNWYFQTFILNYGKPVDIGRVEKSMEAQIALLVDLLRPEGCQL